MSTQWEPKHELSTLEQDTGHRFAEGCGPDHRRVPGCGCGICEGTLGTCVLCGEAEAALDDECQVALVTTDSSAATPTPVVLGRLPGRVAELEEWISSLEDWFANQAGYSAVAKAKNTSVAAALEAPLLAGPLPSPSPSPTKTALGFLADRVAALEKWLPTLECWAGSGPSSSASAIPVPTSASAIPVMNPADFDKLAARVSRLESWRDAVQPPSGGPPPAVAAAAEVGPPSGLPVALDRLDPRVLATRLDVHDEMLRVLGRRVSADPDPKDTQSAGPVGTPQTSRVQLLEIIAIEARQLLEDPAIGTWIRGPGHHCDLGAALEWLAKVDRRLKEGSW